MRVEGLTWVGTRTAEYTATFRFFRDVLGMSVELEQPGFGVLRLPDGATVEIFGPESETNRHLTHPVAGFLVEDLAGAEAELRAAGVRVELTRQDGDDRAWLHFRAPDGFLYELVEVWTAIADDADVRSDGR